VAWLRVAGDEVREHRALKKLEHFFHDDSIGVEVHEQIDPQALLFRVKSPGA
jgi:hypothetical protein